MMWGPSTGQGSHPDISQRPDAKPQLPGPGLPGQVQPWKRVRSEPAVETDLGSPFSVGSSQQQGEAKVSDHRTWGSVL